MTFMDKDFNIIPYASYSYNRFTHSRNIFDLWSDEELAEVGAFRVEYKEIPEGKDVEKWEYALGGIKVVATPVLVDITPRVPDVVSRAQGKAALVIKGYFDGVMDYIDNLEEPNKSLALIALNDTNEWRKDSPFLKECANSLGLDNEGLDDLFTLAESILL